MKTLDQSLCHIVSGGGSSTDVFWDEFMSYSGMSAGLIWGIVMPPVIVVVDVTSLALTATASAVRFVATTSYQALCQFGGSAYGYAQSVYYHNSES